MSSTLIRPLAPSDLPELQKTAIQTFNDAYRANNDNKAMDDYIANKFSLAHLEKEFHSKDSYFYAAFVDYKMVGYLKLNTDSSQTETMPKNALEIQRIYVMANHHGKKIGKQFMDLAIRLTKIREHDYLWLGVWEYNPKAIQFYTNFGFKKFGEGSFCFGGTDQVDLLMRLDVE